MHDGLYKILKSFFSVIISHNLLDIEQLLTMKKTQCFLGEII